MLLLGSPKSGTCARSEEPLVLSKVEDLEDTEKAPKEEAKPQAPDANT